MAKEYLSGPVMWAKVFEHNMDTGEYAPEGGQYTIQIGLNKEDAAKVLSWNRMYKGKEYEEYPGLSFFTFKRKNEVYKKDGITLIEEWGGPPKVCNIDGSDFEGGLIGNGSSCTIKLDVNTVKKGKRSLTFVRLDVVAVEELVEYEAPDSDDGDDEDPETPKEKGKRPF